MFVKLASSSDDNYTTVQNIGKGYGVSVQL